MEESMVYIQNIKEEALKMNAAAVGKLGQKIKEKISEVGISVHALEKKAGLKQSAVQNILYGKSQKPSLHIMQAIAQALNCSVLELLEEETEINPSPGEYSSPPKTPLRGNNEIWNSDLYVDVISMVNVLSKKMSLSLSKEKMLNCAEEVYAYSLKNNKNKPDKHFAEWLVEKTSNS